MQSSRSSWKRFVQRKSSTEGVGGLTLSLQVNERMGIRTIAPSKDNSDSGYSDGFNSDDAEDNVKLRASAKRETSGSGSVFSEDVLKIEICGPFVDYLTIIDVPGIFRTPMEGVTTKADIALVRNMVEGYIKDSRTVILAVLPCNIDISNQEILTLAEEYDKKGERTLGILTKPDLVPEAKSKAAVCSIVRGKKKQLALGYYVVRSRGADEEDADFNTREAMFSQEPWRSLPKDRVGVEALKARLAEVLGHIARREFPKLRKEVSEMLHSAERQRDSLGPSRKDEHEQRLFLSNMARQFQDLVRGGVEAEYSRNEVFEGATQLRLVTQVVSMAESFNRKFRTTAALRYFENEEEEEECDYEEEGEQAVGSLDPDEFPELEGIISHEDDVDDPEEEIMIWLRGLYLRSRGMDLGTFNNAVWTSAFKEQSSKWPSMSRAFVSAVIIATHRFISSALKLVCADDEVREELWSTLLDDLLKRYEAVMAAAKFLVESERATKPYTLDRHFSENRQKARGGRMAELLGKLNQREMLSERTVTLRQVRQATESMSNVDDIVEKLHDDLQAYYEIARNRFVDNVLNQAVNYHLLFGPSTPLGVFSQEWVIGLNAEQLEAIAGESPSTKEHREKLGKKIEDLRIARDILRQ